jgi:hypothetical protein
MYIVKIHRGAHYTDPIEYEYQTIGSLDHIKEGARVHTQRLPATRNKRTWVELFDIQFPDCALTHWSFDEGTL